TVTASENSTSTVVFEDATADTNVGSTISAFVTFTVCVCGTETFPAMSVNAGTITFTSLPAFTFLLSVTNVTTIVLPLLVNVGVPEITEVPSSNFAVMLAKEASSCT